MTLDNASLMNKKILSVEDDTVFANLISMNLSKFGCVVTTAGDSTQTFEKLGKEKPDLILLDLLLPGDMDGFGILEKIKADPSTKDIPVVILSNLSDAQDVDRGMRLGAFLFLTKALTSPDEIASNLASILSSKTGRS